MILRAILPLLGTGLLAGCLAVADPGPAPGPGPMPPPDGLPGRPATPEENADRCGASGVQHLIGRSWPQELPRHMQLVRAFETGSPMTMDYNSDRVNVELSPGSRRIRRIWCG